MQRIPITRPCWVQIWPGTWTVVHKIIAWEIVPIQVSGATT
jgi:hypothetical protein